MARKDKKMVEMPKELHTVEDYYKYQEWAQSLPQKDRIKLIIETFQYTLAGRLMLASNHTQELPVVLVFKDEKLLEEISQELASRKIYMPDYTDEEKVERAKAQLDNEDKSIALSSIVTALMLELKSSIAATSYEEEDHGKGDWECLMIFKDADLAAYITREG